MEPLQLSSVELDSLVNIAIVLAQPGGITEKVTNILGELAEIVLADWVVLRQEDERAGGLRLVAAAGPEALAATPIDLLTDRESMAYTAIRHAEPIISNDYEANPQASPAVVALGVKSMLLMPINAGDMPTGLLSVGSKQANYFTPRRVRLVTAVSSILGPLMENATKFEDLQTRREELAVLDEVARIITSNLDISEVYERFASETRKLVDFDNININLIDQDSGTFVLKYHFGPTLLGIEVGATGRLPGTQSEQVALSGQTLMRENVGVDPRFSTDQSYLALGLRSSIMSPLICKGRVVGTISLWSRRLATYGSREKSILERLANQIAPAVENTLLFEERDRLALALESIGEAVSFTDSMENLQYVNNAFSELYGYSQEEVVGKQLISILAPDNPGSRAVAEEIMEGLQGGWSGEVNGITKDGRLLDLLLTVTPVMGKNGEVIGRIGVSRDITSRKQVEERIKENSQMAALGQLAAVVAHEINNPLTVVLGLSELLIAQDLPERMGDDIRSIHGEARRAATIVQNLLSFARKPEPIKQLTRITQTLEKVMQFKAYDLRMNNIQVTTEWPDDLPAIMVDEPQIIQVILNILANAEQAMVASRGRGELSVTATRVNQIIRITFTDDGPGIPSNLIGQIFDPFFTTKPPGQGTGLGLSICHGIIQEHDGELWAESQLGQGASFHIDLPILPESPG